MQRQSGQFWLWQTLLCCALAVMAAGCALRPADSRDAAQAIPAPEKADVTVGQMRVKLSWTTESETECFGFFIYRGDAETGPFVCLNTRQPLAGAGTTTLAHRYVYYDVDVREGQTYYYKVQQKDFSGASEWIIGGERAVPAPPRPLKPEEVDEIRAHGLAYKETRTQ